MRLSFTERRRRRLAKKVDRLDRLETRNTITEPISISGLLIPAVSGLVRLGIMHPYGGGNALSGLKLAANRGAQASPPARNPVVIHRDLLAPIHGLGAHAGAGGGAGRGDLAGSPDAAKGAAGGVRRLALLEPGAGECVRRKRDLDSMAPFQGNRRRGRASAAGWLKRFRASAAGRQRGDHADQAARIHARRE